VDSVLTLDHRSSRRPLRSRLIPPVSDGTSPAAQQTPAVDDEGPAAAGPSRLFLREVF